MRTYDLTPFYRSTVGFDRLFSLLDQATADGSPGYPPYNIERTGENSLPHQRCGLRLRTGRAFDRREGKHADDQGREIRQ